eukprot:scaffold16334_cov97-Phaeocystis_antarctica.AAC.7
MGLAQNSPRRRSPVGAYLANSAANSKRTFQIPAGRSQNKPGRILRPADFLFLVTKSGAEATDLSAQISQFSFLSSSSAPVSNLERLTFLISRFSMQIQGRPRPGDRTIPVSDFTVHNSGFKKALAHPKPAGSSFLISRFWFQRSPPFMGFEASTFLDSDFSILVAQIAEN